MRRLLLDIGREAGFSAKPVFEILKNLNKDSYPHIKPFLKFVCEESDENFDSKLSFKERWCTGIVDFNDKSEVFDPGEISVLMNFGAEFGNSDIFSVLKLIELTAEYLEKSENKVSEDAEKQGRLRMMLPVYAGMVVCILLI